jgi:hypothetical protein
MNGPHHLAKFNTTVDNDFLFSEEIYRRCPFGNRTPPYTIEDFFLDIQWDKDLINGLSVNRSKYARPEDALWSPIFEDQETQKCKYQEKRGAVYRSKTKIYPAEDFKTGVKFKLGHSPVPCNISHCDIIADNIPSDIDKHKKREIKAFLATLFQELSKIETSSSLIVEDGLMENTILKKKRGEKTNQNPRLGKGCLPLLYLIILILAIIVYW